MKIKNGELINAVDSKGYTPLHYAAERGFANICTMLVEGGADAQLEGNGITTTPMHLAAAMGHPDCVKALLVSAGCRMKVIVWVMAMVM